MDPLSPQCRLASSFPPPRFHTIKYAGVLASACPFRATIAPRPAAEPSPKRGASTYRRRAELRMRAFGLHVLECPRCKGRMRLIAVVSAGG